MSKLHELLAAEPDVKAAALNAASFTSEIFKKGKNKFLGHIKQYRPLDEEGQHFPDENQPIAASVSEALDYFASEYGRWIDIAIQKEVTNQTATASLQLSNDGNFRVLPATALLNLESKLVKLREIYAAIPTNDPARTWAWNGDEERYESPEITNYKTEKVPEAMVGYEATPEHPAQVQWFTKDIRVGEWTQVLYSSMIPANGKRLLLGRIDELIIMVKQARQRANTAEVEQIEVAKSLFDYIHQDNF